MLQKFLSREALNDRAAHCTPSLARKFFRCSDHATMVTRINQLARDYLIESMRACR